MLAWEFTVKPHVEPDGSMLGWKFVVRWFDSATDKTLDEHTSDPLYDVSLLIAEGARLTARMAIGEAPASEEVGV